MAHAATSKYASDRHERINQSSTNAMVRAPGPASTTRASTPVALGTPISGGPASAEPEAPAARCAAFIGSRALSRGAPLLFLGELLRLVFVLQSV